MRRGQHDAIADIAAKRQHSWGKHLLRRRDGRHARGLAAGGGRQVVQFSIGASVDNYGGFAALAIGGSARISDSTIIKMGVRTASGLHMLINVGVGYSW
ncbi:hypothetical protein FAZ95_36700 [Trinickia violacea]|uniref:Trimeric autotransporter adhesin YadA-like C-terminal membrane anchor domain-containing protein n=1 Tax=Trinickia violacea TaxID=2571746 RepID=A0A4P8J2T1_9BURK|nr:hypothetical protein FAZ95_36700 [Trinickia violacea]